MESQIDTSEFLNFLFGDLEGQHFFELTYIDPLKQGAPTESYELDFVNQRWEKPNWDRVMRLNTERLYGVYYGLSLKRERAQRGKRSAESSASCMTVLWADIDLQDGHYASKDAAYQAVCDFDVPASVVIDSGGGLHALWKIAPLYLDGIGGISHIKQTLRGIALALKADPHVAELARVFRLPGTINTKPGRDNAPCHIIDWLPGEVRYEDFEQYRLLAQPPTPRLQRELPRHAPQDLPAYVNWYLDTPQPVGQRNSALNWTAYKMNADGYAQTEAARLLAPRATADGLDEDEINKTVASAFRAAPAAPGYISGQNKVRMRAGDAVRRLLGGAK